MAARLRRASMSRGVEVVVVVVVVVVGGFDGLEGALGFIISRDIGVAVVGDERTGDLKGRARLMVCD